MRVCAACGVVSPRPGLPCDVCAATATRDVPDPDGALYLVSTRCRFQCRGCGRLAPLDDIDLGGTARCVLCGLTQAFDPAAWTEVLRFAHGVGDLAGGEGLHPSPRWAVGPSNPHRDVGVEKTTDSLTIGGSGQVDGVSIARSLRVVAAPGRPLCSACSAVLDVTVESGGRLATACPGCGAAARYEVSSGVLGACKGLRGVIGDGRRADVRDARQRTEEYVGGTGLGRRGRADRSGGRLAEVRAAVATVPGAADARSIDAGGLVALSCPGCGAPLRSASGSRTVECDFCHLVCRLPADGAGTVADRPPHPIWLAFAGPSATRWRLERGGEGGKLEAAATVPQSRWASLFVSLVIAGGMTVMTGLVLFVLMRFGVSFPSSGP